jgi:deoxyribonuclease IV
MPPAIAYLDAFSPLALRRFFCYSKAMKFGVHISGAGGLENIPDRAKTLGCETFQFFSRSPRGGRSVLKAETAELFRNSADRLGFSNYYIHAPYFINLASAEPRIYHSSVSILKDELQRAKTLGARGVIAHLGSSKGMTRQEALQKVITGVIEIIKEAPSVLFMEVSAGAGDIIGATLKELDVIREGALKHNRMQEGMLKIALDTAHLFASGYDLRTAAGLTSLLNEYEKLLGLKNLEVCHVNDSMVGLGEHKDRHEEIGKGKLGLEAFRNLVNEPQLRNLHAILETPKESDEDDLRNLQTIRSLVKK